jgi:hypothetical protein
MHCKDPDQLLLLVFSAAEVQRVPWNQAPGDESATMKHKL